jgi:hypothetical protein
MFDDGWPAGVNPGNTPREALLKSKHLEVEVGTGEGSNPSCAFRF